MTEQVSKDHPALVLVRHAIPIVGLLGVRSYLTPRVGAFATDWLLQICFVFVVSAAVAGLLLLYSRNRTLDRFITNVRNLAWAMAIVLLVGSISQSVESRNQDLVSPSTGKDPGLTSHTPASTARSTTQPTPTAESALQRTNTSQDGAAQRSRGLAKLAELRSQYPELSGLNDEQAARAIHQAFYPEQPFEKIAAALGVQPAK